MLLKDNKLRIGLFLSVIIAVGLGTFIGVYFAAINNQGDYNKGASEDFGNIVFIKPSFPETVLDEEAGISIYTDIGQPLDLSAASAEYKTIEEVTSDYVIGSLSLPNLPETEDIHCFVHKDGWIVVYYLKAEPVSKVIDWNWYSAGSLTKTKLNIGLEKMYLALGVTPPSTNFYHFQFPHANKWMIIIEALDEYGTDSFNLQIPSEFTFYERSWSHYADGRSRFRLDDIQISFLIGNPVTAYDELTPAQLIPDEFHTISLQVEAYSPYLGRVAIVVVYLEP